MFKNIRGLGFHFTDEMIRSRCLSEEEVLISDVSEKRK